VELTSAPPRDKPGGMIDPDLLLRAYAIGVFPMADARDADEVFWVEPKRRAILPLDGFRLSHSLRKTIRAGTFTVTCDKAFPEVVRRCAEREETWINAEIERATLGLHAAGNAHSIECWQGSELVGGLYGVRLGRAFFGESMFSRIDDGSKIALHWLCRQLREWDFELMDCQISSPHLATLGAIELPREEFLERLRGAVAQPGPTGRWRFDLDVPARAEHLE